MIGSILLSSSGFFFLLYLVHVSILGTAGQLLDVGQNVWRWWKLRAAVTAVEIDAAMKVCLRFVLDCYWLFQSHDCSDGSMTLDIGTRLD